MGEPNEDEVNLQHPDYCKNGNPESSRSKRVQSGEKMVNVQGKVKVEASADQAKRRGRKPTLTPEARNANKITGDRQRRLDQKTLLGKLAAMVEEPHYRTNGNPEQMDPDPNKIAGDPKRRKNPKTVETLTAIITEFGKLRNTNAELVGENRQLNSKVAAMAEEIEKLKSNDKQNCLMDFDFPELPVDGNGDNTFFDFAELEKMLDLDFHGGSSDLINGGLATNNLTTEGNGTSQTGILELELTKVQSELEELKTTNKQLVMENKRLNSELTDLAQKLETLKNNEKTAGKDTTLERAIGMKRKGEEEPNEARKGKRPMVVHDTPPPPRLPTSGIEPRGFMSNALRLIRQINTQSPLLSLAGGAESREASHDHVKNMTACISLASYFAQQYELEIARAQRESRAQEEDGANQVREPMEIDD